MKLNQEERIDDLQLNGLKIIQNKKGFCFGIDAILLSDFAKNIKNNATVLDLGTGTGIISILLCEKTELKKIVGVEIQKEVYEMALKSCQLNNLQERFELIHSNITQLDHIYAKNSFDVIVTNPPYKKGNTGIMNDTESKKIARHELTASLEDFIKIGKDLLKDKGEFYMVHRPERLVDIFSMMRYYKIEPKEIQFVYSTYQKPPKLVLIKGVKNAKEFLKVHSNLYIYDEKGHYTEEIYQIYQKNQKEEDTLYGEK